MVKQSLSEGAAAKARDLGRVVFGLLGRSTPEPVRLGGLVGNVMTRAVSTCSTADTLHRAAQIMWERDCGIVPVVDSEGRVVGVVTDRDLCIASYTQGRPLGAITTSSLLSGRVVHACAPGDSLDHAMALMRSHRVRRLVVVEGSQRLVGVLALSDIASYVASLGPSRADAHLLLSDLLASLSARRPGTGSTERAAQ
jgi:CBS domain-containing protein